jgi:tRNA 2-thiouridine synthesizing protein E
MLTVNGIRIATDAEGYLADSADWNPQVAEAIARNEGLTLTPAHWEVIELLRRFYAEFDLSPAMRPLVKYAAMHLGTGKGKSVYLLSLFPGSPPKLGAKIAGLPRPANCL